MSGGAIIELHDEVTNLTIVEQVVEIIEIADFATVTDKIPASLATAEGQIPVSLGASSWTKVTEPASSGLLLTSDLSMSGKIKWSAAPVGIMGIDGWTTADAWVYVSSTSFKVTGIDVTARYCKGTKLKCTDGGSTKYFYVIGSSYSTDTTVTITGGSDFSLSGGAITNPYFSHQETPEGFPQWFNWAAVASGSGGSAGTYAQTLGVAKFSVIGRKCTVMLTLKVTNVGSWSGVVYVNAPIVLSSDNAGQFGYSVVTASLATKANLVLLSGSTVFQWRTVIAVTTFDWGGGGLVANDYIDINTDYII